MLTQNEKPTQKRIIPRTGSNITDYEKHNRRIIKVLVDVNLQQKNIPKYDPEYGVTMKELKDRTRFNRNTLRKHLLVGLKKTLHSNKKVQIYPPLLGTVVKKRNKRYFLEPAANIFPIWEYLVNELSAKLFMQRKVDYIKFFYENVIAFIPNTQDTTRDVYNIMAIPLSEWQKCLKVLHIQEIE